MAGAEDEKKDTRTTGPSWDNAPTAPYGPAQDQAVVQTERLFDSAVLESLAARYDVLGELGRGGMGAVYRARDRETGDVVALKVLLPEIAAQPDLIERFKSELLLARKVTHKNVCRVYELLRFGETAAIAMEYVEGESLRAFLRRYGSAPLRRGLEWAKQICSALAEAHAQGVVHRDLKPENVLIARDGSVKVMDFGLAHSLQTGATKTAGISGTPAYMSPEQAAGKPVDHRTDVYSLGLMLYEMFTAQSAFRADTPVALAMKHIHERPPAPRDVEPYLPVFLERAIEKCLEKHPKSRFQSIGELETALAEEKESVLAPEAEPVPPPELSVWTRRDWILLALSMASLLYFLGVRERVFPASRMRLQVDAISARRIAEDVAQKLGRPFPEFPEASLESRADRYARAIQIWVLDFGKAKPRPPVSTVWPNDLVVWTVRFTGPYDRALAEVQEVPERFVTLDNSGRVERFFYLLTQVPVDYKPAAVEERRAIARRAAETACGALPVEWQLRDSSGGERGALYTAVWGPRQLTSTTRAVQVSLLAEKVVDVRCKEPPRESILPPEAAMARVQTWLGFFFFLARGVLGGVLLVLFLLGRCYRSPGLWRKIPVAVVLGVPMTWLLAPEVTGGEEGKGILPTLPLLSITAFAVVFTVWAGLVTAEHYLRRYWPEKIASYLLVFQGRWAESIVGLSVLRGALLGLALLGIQTALLHSGAILGDTFWTKEKLGLGEMTAFFFPAFLSPAPVSRALVSFSSTAFVVASVLSLSVVAAVIMIGLPLAWNWRKLQTAKRKNPHPRATMVSNTVLVICGAAFNLQLAAFLPRPYGALVGLGLFAALLAWLALRYDVLTTTVAIGTAVLWNLNHPLLVILREVGNASHWFLFIAWGAFVLLAAALAFRAELRRVLQQMTASE